MPEGDTVWLAARRLHAALAGQRLSSADFRVPHLATADLAGQLVREVVSRGKHLLGRTDQGQTLHSHLGMEGAWHLYPAGARWRGGPEWQVRVVLRTEGRQAVGYRLRKVDLLPTVDEDSVVGHLGPDLLGPDWDADAAVARLLADPANEIGVALLDQRNLAGIGTLYRSETLFLHGVHPRTPVGDVPDLPGLVERARRLMDANRERPEQVTTGDARRGRHRWVFERAGRPCRRCGSRVKVDHMGPAGMQRVSYWCTSCQPERVG